MRKKIIPILIIMLMTVSTVLPVLGTPIRSGSSGKKDSATSGTSAVNLDVAITTDYVNGYDDHGLRIREFNLTKDVYAYFQISSTDVNGLYLTQKWWYNNGTGLKFEWSYSMTVDGHYTGYAVWTWWAIGKDYGKGIGYIEFLVNNVTLGSTNYYSDGGNSPPTTPTITGNTSGNKKTPYTYNFTGSDPDGFKVSYYVDWGDNTTANWTTFTASNVPIKLTHTWTTKGTYTIKCKVKDLIETESDWGTLSVTMPCSYETPKLPFFELFFQRFPNAFPVLRQLFGY
jgi:hypothetical protein